MIYTLLLIYFILLLSLLISWIIINRHIKTIQKKITTIIDDIFFDISIFLYKNKNDIVKVKEFAEFLLYPKNKFIKYGFNIKNIKFFVNNIKKHIKESEEIINKQILSSQDIKNLEELVIILDKLIKLKSIFKKLLCILSFGILCFL